MFAIIKTGGKQYKVIKDEKLNVETIEAEEGATVTLETLYGEGGKKATVTAKIFAHIKAPKVTIFKKKRRQNYRRKRGHRQPQTVIQITDIKAA